MGLNMISFYVKISVATFADFECSEIVLFAYWVLTRSARHLPPEASVAVLAKTTWAGLSLEVQIVLLQIREDVHVFTKDILVKSISLELPDVVDRSKLIAEVRILEFFDSWQGCRANLVGAPAT